MKIESMKNFVWRYKWYALGALLGSIAGFLYWKYIGCLSGTCAITSSPVNSTVYFALMGMMIPGFFTRTKSKNPEHD